MYLRYNFCSCFYMPGVRSLRINCLGSQFWKTLNSVSVFPCCCETHSNWTAYFQSGSIPRKLFNGGINLDIFKVFKGLIHMENLALFSAMAYCMDILFHFFVPLKHKSSFVWGCCVHRLPVSSWGVGWRSRMKHFPFTFKNFVFTSWVLSEVTESLSDFLWVCMFYAPNQWKKTEHHNTIEWTACINLQNNRQ